MTSGSFRLNVLMRVILIGLQISLLTIVIINTSWLATSLLLVVITLFTVAELLRYVERSNREFSDFLQAIKSADFATHYEIDKRGHSFSKLRQAYNSIVAEFQAARIDKEAHYTFLQTVVNQVSIAIISFDQQGEIKLLNEAARQMLDLPLLNNVHQWRRFNPELYTHLLSDVNEVAEITVGQNRLKLLFRSASFRLQENEHRLILITNVKPEIDRTEVEAWEQLLHVLTHEIMNSITPISSLSGTIKDHLNELISSKNLDDDMLADMSEGLLVIEKRSEGLISFVNNYRSLISVPEPNLKKIRVQHLFERIRLLVSNRLEEQGIALRVDIESNLLLIVADESLMEQLLLNLIYNAADALEGVAEPVIELSAQLHTEQTVIRVSDNGVGIPPELIGKIFIPFFTTKNSGTGIGLSLSKQIMRLHRGSIDVFSQPGQGTTITLLLP
jgi:two-component system, NtrC family, nitrogen regulation sensor histidine kinase NtrY